MGLFSKLFKKKETIANNVTDNMSFESPECQNLWDLKVYMDTVLSQNRYVAKSEYRAKLLEGKKTVEYFGVLQSSRLLDAFCKNNGLSLSVVESALSKYINFEALVDEHNESFICCAMCEEQQYFDNILNDVDPKIKLDEDQRRVILTDEDYCLVIAGAGAGKTTTVAAKVKYLVEKRGIEPSQSLFKNGKNYHVKCTVDIPKKCQATAILQEKPAKALLWNIFRMRYRHNKKEQDNSCSYISK